MFYTHLQTRHHHQKKKKKKPMWKYILKEKLHAWFENEREQESAFGELKINQAWRVMYIPVFFFFFLSLAG